jgi:maltose alpha-D-glucosyltransferase/alpha-amylase
MRVDHEDHAVIEVAPGSPWWRCAEVAGRLESTILPPFLARARWYPGQHASGIKTKLIAMIPLAEEQADSACLAVVEVAPAGMRYVLPMQAEWSWQPADLESNATLAELREGDRIGILREVAGDHGFITQLMENLRKQVSVGSAGNDWRLIFSRTSRLSEDAPHAPKSIRAISGEQSNSTALVDQNYVIKLYRRLEPGENPEVELGRFLTEVAGFSNTPALLGDVQIVKGQERHTLAIVHCFVANQGDAWKFSSERISRYSQEVNAGPAASDRATQIRNGYLRWVATMGRRVAEMHRALASDETLPQFKPDPIDAQDLDYWSRDLLARADRVFAALERHRPSRLDGALVERVLGAKVLLPELVRRLLQCCLGRCKIRHHGDLHLGQILVVDDDAFIIDFEGEPSRSIAERRRKAPAARDVAGVIRSLDYSAMAALQELPESFGSRSDVQAALLDWRDASAAAFLRAYREAVGDTVLWPETGHDAQAMLDFFLLEKALYEVEYELSYRPAWLGVPLRGIVSILEGAAHLMSR